MMRKPNRRRKPTPLAYTRGIGRDKQSVHSVPRSTRWRPAARNPSHSQTAASTTRAIVASLGHARSVRTSNGQIGVGRIAEIRANGRLRPQARHGVQGQRAATSRPIFMKNPSRSRRAARCTRRFASNACDKPRNHSPNQRIQARDEHAHAKRALHSKGAILRCARTRGCRSPNPKATRSRAPRGSRCQR